MRCDLMPNQMPSSIVSDKIKTTYKLAGKTRAAIRGFINYLTKFEKNKKG